MTERRLSADAADDVTSPDINTTSGSSSHCDADAITRMKLYEHREQEFIEFVKESHLRSAHLGLLNDEGPDEPPLSGLQCLLALTEILDRAAQLRVANFDLEQRIQVLQKFKMIAEVQNELHNAVFDITANGIARNKKSKTHVEVEGGYLKRSFSAESLDTSAVTPTRTTENHSVGDFGRKSGTGKASRLSETWGKVKDKLAPKEAVTVTPSFSKSSRRHRSADLAGSMRVSLGGETSSVAYANSTNPAHFTQREINISPPQRDDGDFGGVWLGDGPGEGANAETGSMDFGGVWLGPPSIVHLSNDTQTAAEVPSTESSQGRLPGGAKESLERHYSEPLGSNKQSISKSEHKHKVSADITFPAIRTASYDELQKNKNKDNQSPTFLRKKSSKILAQAAQLLPGSEQKKVKKVDSANELPKEFRKKIEEWHIIKDTEAALETAETLPSTKFGKGSKSKTQRFKNKKRGGVLKQRSKSADRVETGSASKGRHDQDFDEKLREWSLKQGYHASYYTDIRDRQRSAESIGDSSCDRGCPDDFCNEIDSCSLNKGYSDNYLTVNTQISSCSSSSLSPAVTVNSLRSAENLQTLYEISQSSDQVFHREAGYSSKSSRKLSRSEETLSIPAGDLLITLTEKSASATSSSMDLYARASDQSLEKHLSLCHMTSENSVYSPVSSEHINTSDADDTRSESEAKNEVISLLTNVCNIGNEISNSGQPAATIQLSACVEEPKVMTLKADPHSPLSPHNHDLLEESLTTPVCEVGQDLPIIDHLSENNCTVSQTASSDNTFSNNVIKGFTKESEKNEHLEGVSKYCESVNSTEHDTKQSEKTLIRVTSSDNHVKEEPLNGEMLEQSKGNLRELQNKEARTASVSNPSDIVGNLTAKLFDMKETAVMDNTSSKSGAEADTKTSSDVVYDLNSNITNAEKAEKQSENSDKNVTRISKTPLYIGTEVPLKLRLKSLALEYERADSKGQHTSTSNNSNSSNNTHKRTRSDEPISITSKANCSTTKTPQQRSKGPVVHEIPKAPSTISTYNPSIHSTRSQGSSLVSLGHNHLNKPQRSNIHHLKSADELIYDQSPLAKSKRYTRNGAFDNAAYSGFSICNRRELFEKPKEGTVKKALSMFLDNGTFNTQFGTDFGRSTAKPEST